MILLWKAILQSCPLPEASPFVHSSRESLSMGLCLSVWSLYILCVVTLTLLGNVRKLVQMSLLLHEEM